MKKLIALVVIFVILLSGCVQSVNDESHTPKTTYTPTPKSEITATPTSSQGKTTPVLPTTQETPYIPPQTPSQVITENLKFGVKYGVKVVDVVDGDTIDVIFSDGSWGRVRMLGVDTPEKSAERNKPGEYDGIDDLKYLAEWGWKAYEFTKSMLEGKYIYIEFDENSGFTGYYGRLLAYVYLENGTDFTAMLVEKGYARVYVEGEFEKENYYLQLEETAKREGRGLWNILVNASPSQSGAAIIEIVEVHYDAGGPDVDDRDMLNDEYVVIKNYGTTSVNLDGWKLKDEVGFTYTFSNVVLGAGDIITIHTGIGDDYDGHLYWDRKSPVWNNDHDTAYLYNEQGELVDEYGW